MREWRIRNRGGWRIGALLAGLLLAPLPALAEDVDRVRLKADVLEEPDLAPPWGVREIREALPADLAGRAVSARREGPRLRIDLDGRGHFTTRLSSRKPKVVDVGTRESPRPLLCFERIGRWYASSASTLRGKAAGRAVEILDVDLDGRFDGARDAIRFAPGVFRPVVPDDLALVDGALCRYRVVQGDGGSWGLEIREEPRFAAARPTVRDTLTALAEFREGVGLSPVLEDEAKSEGCRLHVAYWRQNGFSGHDEEKGRPGYTAEGARAGHGSSVTKNSDPVETIRRITFTVLHRQTALGPSAEGLGLAWEPGCCLWGGRIDTKGRLAPILVPGPGQEEVPLACREENPAPAALPDFYETPRGYPVSVTWSGIHRAENVAIRLWQVGRKTIDPVDGFVFTPERPYHSVRPGNASSAFFVATEPLLSEQRYVAEFTAEHPEHGVVAHTWAFTTE